jgi:hypothetical protein
MHGVCPPLVADVTTQALRSTRIKAMKRNRAGLADWTDFNRSDPGVALLELLSYVGDMLAHYQDEAAEEARLATRRRYALALGAISVALIVCWRRRAGAGDG